MCLSAVGLGETEGSQAVVYSVCYNERKISFLGM